jgi:hypothetical protein
MFGVSSGMEGSLISFLLNNYLAKFVGIDKHNVQLYIILCIIHNTINNFIVVCSIYFTIYNKNFWTRCSCMKLTVYH